MGTETLNATGRAGIVNLVKVVRIPGLFAGAFKWAFPTILIFMIFPSFLRGRLPASAVDYKIAPEWKINNPNFDSRNI